MKTDNGRGELLRVLQKKLSYQFKDAELLKEALTHSSYANENGVKFNERLEFLGDAVLELVTSNKLFLSYPNYDEGQLTRLRAQIVCKSSLNLWAAEIGLKSLIRIGKSLIKSGPTDSVAADCVEALFGAIFIDGGFHNAAEAVSNFLKTKPETSGATVIKDFKTELQEHFQQQGMEVPCYETLERTGPEHALNFKVRLMVGGEILAEARGSSTKEAEFRAAQTALKKIGEKNSP